MSFVIPDSLFYKNLLKDNNKQLYVKLTEKLDSVLSLMPKQYVFNPEKEE